MKKLLILFLAIGILGACNNDKGTNKQDDRGTNTKDKDDYRKDDDKNNDRTDDKDSRNTSDKDDYSNNSRSNWTRSDVDEFVNSCVREAVKGGMVRSKAEDYCSCMQKKLENIYPDTRDVGDVDMETPSMKRLVKDCLGNTGSSDNDDSYSSSGWTRRDEDKFVNDCIGTARQNVGQARAEEYCECMLRKVKRMYSSYNEADRELKGITQRELEDLAADCNY